MVFEKQFKKTLQSSKHLHKKNYNLDNLMFQGAGHLLKYQFWNNYSI